ncbi:MAG: hypothetical protein HZA22_09470 [Nitrospirae bacterium]|nr:hypothetical protein [Nitrospirota bacterium]MBI5695947.1 hypothetical protein [Nitrospirota bacterium]
MEYVNKTKGGRWGLPVVMLALILGLALFGGIAGPSTALAATISCGQCHSNPPADADNGGCKQTTKSHPQHASGADLTTCERCHPAVAAPGHPTAGHNNNVVNITSVVAPGLSYNSGNSTCANACHDNIANPVWGDSGNCNLCHFRHGATGNYAMSGLHVTNDKSFKHYSSPIKVNTSETITCVHCHPNNDGDTGLTHINTPAFAKKADMSEAHTYVNVTGIGYSKHATDPNLGTCSLSCHYNPTDPFGNYTIIFKPGQRERFGTYQSAAWGDTDLKCNECHSTPSQSATFGHATSFLSKNANKRHEAHMFKYKLNPWNFQSEDRNIYCDDCHRTPDTTYGARGFHNHSTLGEAGSGVISLPVKSQNARVYMLWRNNGIGRDDINPPSFNTGTKTCSNVYCHTLMVSGDWTEESCDACHGKQNGVNVGSGAPGYANWTANFRSFEDYSGGGGAHYTHVTKRGYACRSCHYDGGGDGNAANHHNVSERVVIRANVNVGVHPDYWFNNRTSYYNLTTRSCSDVKCHYGASQNWDCEPLH